MSEPATLRFVTYLDPEVLDILPPELVADWPSEDACTPIRKLCEEIEDEDERDMLVAEVRDFVAEVATYLQRDVLPEGDALDFTYLGLGGAYQIVGRREGIKVRVDRDLNVAILRRTPREMDDGKPRFFHLRQEMLEVLALPLAGPDRKPIQADVRLDLGKLERDAIYAEFKAPVATGFMNGQYDRLRIYSDGKITLLGLVPTRFEADAYKPPGAPGTAAAGDPRYRVIVEAEPPAAGLPGTGAPPEPGSPNWTEEDDARVADNQFVADAVEAGVESDTIIAALEGDEPARAKADAAIAASKGKAGGAAAGAAGADGGGGSDDGAAAGTDDGGAGGAANAASGSAAAAGGAGAATGARAAAGAGATAKDDAAGGKDAKGLDLPDVDLDLPDADFKLPDTDMPEIPDMPEMPEGLKGFGDKMRLDKKGDLMDDGVDMGAWDAGKLDA